MKKTLMILLAVAVAVLAAWALFFSKAPATSSPTQAAKNGTDGEASGLIASIGSAAGAILGGIAGIVGAVGSGSKEAAGDSQSGGGTVDDSSSIEAPVEMTE